MLQHEQAAPTAPLNYAPLNYKPITPYELAQAVVAVEDGQGSDTQTTIDSAVIRQTLEQGRMDVTPEQLLKEVQMQRSIAHQDAVMTRRKNRNLPLQLLAGASILISLTAASLLAYSFVITRQLRTSNEALARSYEKETRATAAGNVDASQALQKWIYPGAVRNGSSSGGHIGSLGLTTSDSYLTVWEHYFGQAGGADIMRRLHVNTDGGIPLMGASGAIQEGGQTVNYQMTSGNGPSGPSMTFTTLSSQATVTGTVVYDAASKKTIIKLIATTPIPVP